MLLLSLFAVLPVFELGHSARILGVIPTPSYSHQIAFRPLWNELARRGHDVVVITTDPQNNPDLNITEIDISAAYEIWEKSQIIKLFNESNLFNFFQKFKQMLGVFMEICITELLHPEVQAILRNQSEHFDLVMVEYVLPPMFGFGHRFKCPYIGVISMEMSNTLHSVFGNPSHPVVYPDAFGMSVGNMNFWQRLGNTLLYLINSFAGRWVFGTHDVRNFMEEQFGSDIPPIGTILRNASMIFINEDPALTVRPLGPAFVLFGGGSHLMPQKPLPKDLQNYLDGAEDGFIYFSLGTNVKSDIFLPEMRQTVLDVFRELPYRVLWKFDVTDIPDVPDNVKISTWLPQHDILRHPKIKVFITQGGLQSTEEAIFSHVPIVGIPFIADQIGNVKKIVAKGGGVFIDKNSVTKESLKEALLEVINNPKYKESITEVAELSRDQPMSGLDKAIWWTEYVIRHKGAPHFRNPAMDIPFYQYYFLDVIGFSVGALSLAVFIIYELYVFVKYLIRVVRKYRSNTKKIKKS